MKAGHERIFRGPAVVGLSRALLLPACLALAAQAQEVPLEFGLHQELILPVQAEAADGTLRPLRLLLDTGAVSCMLDPRHAKGLTGAQFRPEVAQGFSGAGRHVLARILHGLRCGTATQAGVPVQVMALDYVNRGLDRPVDGVIGLSFLAGRRFTLDPGRRVLTWEPEPVKGRTVALAPRTGDLRPWATLRVGSVETQALLDTGCTAALVLPRELAGSSFLPGCDVVSGVDGMRTITEARVRVEAFGETFPRRRAIIGGGQVILGLPFFLAGPVTFDLRAGRLTLVPNPDGHLPRPSLAEEGAHRLPIGWNRRGAIPYLDVDPLPACHPWYQAGFRDGDRILAADQLEGASLTLAALDGWLRTGRILDWKVQRGRAIVTLRNPSEDPRLEPLDR
ncbi:MAG TPA: retropepsin-like aspartic protease [Geothrix sp.]|nr:retropepsin-like aspartic protease [Geothrix sp.]